jgi:hypothetical protein
MHLYDMQMHTFHSQKFHVQVWLQKYDAHRDDYIKRIYKKNPNFILYLKAVKLSVFIKMLVIFKCDYLEI